MKNGYEKKGGIQQVGQSLIGQVATYCRFNVFIHLNALVSGIQGFLGSFWHAGWNGSTAIVFRARDLSNLSQSPVKLYMILNLQGWAAVLSCSGMIWPDTRNSRLVYQRSPLITAKVYLIILIINDLKGYLKLLYFGSLPRVMNKTQHWKKPIARTVFLGELYSALIVQSKVFLMYLFFRLEKQFDLSCIRMYV